MKKLKVPKPTAPETGLSKTMMEALEKLKDWGGWVSAYDLKEKVPTMAALADRGLVDVKYGSGCYIYPRTCIKFRIKKEMS